MSFVTPGNPAIRLYGTTGVFYIEDPVMMQTGGGADCVKPGSLETKLASFPACRLEPALAK